MSASSSSGMSSSALAAALGAPPAQQLTRNNFLLWKALVLPAFRGANVMALLDGSDRAPARTIEVEDSEKNKTRIPNPAHIEWMARDQQVLRFLLNTLSPEILSHLLDVTSTAEAWAAIGAMFKTASRTKAQHLRGELNDTKKLSLTADQYYTKMRGFASELSALGKPVEDDELLGYLLHGLDKGEYNALITTVNGNPGTSLEEFYEQLSSYDMRNGVEENGSFISSANLARRGDQRSRARTPPPRGRTPPPPRARSPDRGPYRGGGYREDDRNWRKDDGRGNYRRDNDNWRRDDRRGDRRDDRRDRRRDDGGGYRRTDGRRSDRVPTPYVDTECQICATDHITSELNKLLIANKYHGQDRVRTAEGTVWRRFTASALRRVRQRAGLACLARARWPHARGTTGACVPSYVAAWHCCLAARVPGPIAACRAVRLTCRVAWIPAPSLHAEQSGSHAASHGSSAASSVLQLLHHLHLHRLEFVLDCRKLALIDTKLLIDG
ncbi:hypothetical protein QYE76_063591 [Lolium multiflorum]|uniref:Uncharacterized protein n=1 Tax=Lolium multiflorum TaxID=4521 RepID=A0AAD8S4U9_LOLMU|nr:hypothetical protein QYE76_063591 [Lolium multiflorum]